MDSVAQVEVNAGKGHGVLGVSVERPPVGARVQLPALGEKFTEEEISKRFGVEMHGGIRVNRMSKIIVLVNRVDVQTQYNNVEYGKHLVFNGQYYENCNDQMQSNNLMLANSSKDGYEVLYFVKEDGMLAFNGRVEFVSAMPTPSGDGHPGRGISFKLKLIKDKCIIPALPADANLNTIEMIEDLLSLVQKFDTRGALLESLRHKVSRESLDRILGYLARSGKIEISGATVQWIADNRHAVAAKAEIIESYLETLDILADPDFARQLEESEEDYRAGRVVPWIEDSAQNTR